MAKFDSAKRVMSGTWGEVWLDNEYVAEAYKFSAKISYNKQAIARCGQMANDQKVTSYSGTGSIGMHKINSRMGRLMGYKIRDGQDVRFTIIAKLDDPDAYGSERVALYNVSLDEVPLVNWERKTIQKDEVPFTFTSHKFLEVA